MSPKLDKIASVRDSNISRMTISNFSSILGYYYSIYHEGLCEGKIRLYAFGSLIFLYTNGPIHMRLVFW